MLKSGATAARSALVRSLIFGISVLILRFVYVVTIHGQSCASSDFCFFSSPSRRQVQLGAAAAPPRGDDRRTAVRFYAAVLQDLIMDGFLSPGSKSLSFESSMGFEVAAMRQIGVTDAIGIGRKASPPMVIAANPLLVPFEDGVFDFVFLGPGTIEKSRRPVDQARELAGLVKED